MSRIQLRGGGEAVSGEHLREAERGFLALLRAKRFPAAWIDKNVIDLLAQAASEYAAWMQGHPAEPNPVGWLITCAYRRAINLLDSERRRPPTTSLDAVVDLTDKGTPTPEQEALANDRHRRLREALGHLPAKDRKLLSLVYFEERSVREAGRRLGWRKSAADRHHRAALERLREIVGDDRTMFSPAVLGLAAWVVIAEDRGAGLKALPRTLATLAHDAGAPVAELARRLGSGIRRLLPIAEPGGAAASAGAGRVAGACGAGLVAAVCGLVVAGVHPPLPGAGEPASKPQVAVPKPRVSREQVAAEPQASPEGESGGHSERQESTKRRSGSAERSASSRRPAAPESTESSQQVVEEFGVERESAGEGQVGAPATNGSSEPSASSPPGPQRASGAQVNEEFGL